MTARPMPSDARIGPRAGRDVTADWFPKSCREEPPAFGPHYDALVKPTPCRVVSGRHHRSDYEGAVCSATYTASGEALSCNTATFAPQRKNWRTVGKGPYEWSSWAVPALRSHVPAHSPKGATRDRTADKCRPFTTYWYESIVPHQRDELNVRPVSRDTSQECGFVSTQLSSRPARHARR